MDTTKDNPLRKRDQEPYRVPKQKDRPAKEEPGTRKDNSIEEPEQDRPL